MNSTSNNIMLNTQQRLQSGSFYNHNPSVSRRFYLSMGNPWAGKGITYCITNIELFKTLKYEVLSEKIG